MHLHFATRSDDCTEALFFCVSVQLGERLGFFPFSGAGDKEEAGDDYPSRRWGEFCKHREAPGGCLRGRGGGGLNVLFGAEIPTKIVALQQQSSE